MPTNPSTPSNGTYTSTCEGDLSSWSGSFTYTSGAIVYTRTSPAGSYTTSNKSNGNAIVFDITAGTETVQFNGPTFTSQPNGKAQYSGHCEKTHTTTGTQNGWTASQTT